MHGQCNFSIRNDNCYLLTFVLFLSKQFYLFLADLLQHICVFSLSNILVLYLLNKIRTTHSSLRRDTFLCCSLFPSSCSSYILDFSVKFLPILLWKWKVRMSKILITMLAIFCKRKTLISSLVSQVLKFDERIGDGFMI